MELWPSQSETRTPCVSSRSSRPPARAVEADRADGRLDGHPTAFVERRQACHVRQPARRAARELSRRVTGVGRSSKWHSASCATWQGAADAGNAGCIERATIQAATQPVRRRLGAGMPPRPSGTRRECHLAGPRDATMPDALKGDEPRRPPCVRVRLRVRARAASRRRTARVSLGLARPATCPAPAASSRIRPAARSHRARRHSARSRRVRSSRTAAARSASRLAWLWRRARSLLSWRARSSRSRRVRSRSSSTTRIALLVEHGGRAVAGGAHALGLGGVTGALAAAALGSARRARARDAQLGLGDACLGGRRARRRSRPIVASSDSTRRRASARPSSTSRKAGERRGENGVATRSSSRSRRRRRRQRRPRSSQRS